MNEEQGSAQGFDPFHELLVDAIVGVGVPLLLAHEFEKTGMVVFTGNQHNPMWDWKRRALEACSTEALQELYGSLKSYLKADRAQRNEMAGQIVVPQGTPGSVHGHGHHTFEY